jgi:hypothetical protein
MTAAMAARDWLTAQGRPAVAGGPSLAAGPEIVCHDITATDDRSEVVQIDHATVQFDVWDDTYSGAATTAGWLKRRLRELRGATQLNTGTICLGCESLAGPGFLPDPETDRPRFTLTAVLTVRTP